MTVKELNELIATGREHEFYAGSEWKAIAAQVRKLDRKECQLCKEKGRYSRGEIVHHVKHLKDRPDLATTVYDPDTKARQLITVCKRCHEEQHPDALRSESKRIGAEITEERWE